MKPISIIFATFALLLCGCGGNSSSFKPEPIPANPLASQTLQDYVVSTGQVGASAAIVKGDKLVWAGATGTANKALATNTTTDTVFLCASVTKPITAAAVMTLVEKGKLDLDADVSQYLPFKLTNPKSPTSKISLRSLLAHTSGLSDLNFASYFPERTFYYQNQDPQITLEAFIQGFLAPGGAYYSQDSFLPFAAGTNYEYCNIGYALVGYIVKRVTGQSLATYCDRAIFKPLAMTHSSYLRANFKDSELAMPYDVDETALTHYTSANWPAVSVRTTAVDLARFMRVLINGGSSNGIRILSAASVAEMRKVQYPLVAGAQNECIGLDYRNLGAVYQGHLGEEYGATGVFYFDPSTNVGAVILFNTGLQPQIETLPVLFNNLIGIGQAG